MPSTMTASSEDVLLQVGQVRYKKGDGTLYIMNERMAWMVDHRDHVSVSHRYTDIKLQKISPDGKSKIQLQVVLHDGSASTFQFVNRQGIEAQKRERDNVKELLQHLLLKFKKEINKELEEKNRVLSENPAMLQLYRDLVITQVISSEEFWQNHTSQFTKNYQPPRQEIGVTGAFLADIKPQTDGCNGLKYNLTTDVIECIFKTYPTVKQKHLEDVPTKVTEGEFWTKFFQSHYFHRDRMNGGTRDLFTDCAKLDDLEIRKEINGGFDDTLVDLRSFDEKFMDDGYGQLGEKNGLSGNIVHQSMIKRFNQHSIMVIKAGGTIKNGMIEVLPVMTTPPHGKNNFKNNYKNNYKNNHIIKFDELTNCSNGFITNINSGFSKQNGPTTSSPESDTSSAVSVSSTHVSKKMRLQEKINYVDLNLDSDMKPLSSVTKPPMNLEKVDRYLQGPASLASTDLTDGLQVTGAMNDIQGEVDGWIWSHRGMAPVNPAAAVSALGELTPGGALMKGFREDSLQLVPKETEQEMKHLYLSLCELLRHFWASFPPTTPNLEVKAVKMHEAVQRFHQARLKPFEDRVLREYSPLSHDLTSHLNQLLNNAYRKFATWQQRKLLR